MPCFQFYIHNCLIGCEYKILTSAVLVVVNMVMIVIMIMKWQEWIWHHIYVVFAKRI